MSICKIYLATFPNGKKYVGQTWQTMEARKAQHKYRGCKALHAAIKKYGMPVWEVITHALNEDVANWLENYYMRHFNTIAPNGYNIEKWADNKRVRPRTKRTAEQRKRMSVAALKSWETRDRTGRPHPQEHKDYMSKIANKRERNADGTFAARGIASLR